jgi:hypothetical protein
MLQGQGNWALVGTCKVIPNLEKQGARKWRGKVNIDGNILAYAFRDVKIAAPLQ